MRSSHVSALSPFVLDGVPGVPRCSSSDNAKTCDVRTIKYDVPPRNLVSKIPFIEGRGS
jgi:hypothetical protein